MDFALHQIYRKTLTLFDYCNRKNLTLGGHRLHNTKGIHSKLTGIARFATPQMYVSSAAEHFQRRSL